MRGCKKEYHICRMGFQFCAKWAIMMLEILIWRRYSGIKACRGGNYLFVSCVAGNVFHREILLICNLYRYITLQKNLLYPSRIYCGGGLLRRASEHGRNSSGACSKGLWSMNQRASGQMTCNIVLFLYIHFTFHCVKL